MKYFFSKVIDMPFDTAIDNITEELKKEGFGIMSDIDVKATLKEKSGVDFRKYRILGACNPTYALKALETEQMIGLMMPCNVVVHETDEGKIEVAVVDPVASIFAIENNKLKGIFKDVQVKLVNALGNL